MVERLDDMTVIGWNGQLGPSIGKHIVDIGSNIEAAQAACQSQSEARNCWHGN
jgi:hypothetical protein